MMHILKTLLIGSLFLHSPLWGNDFSLTINPFKVGQQQERAYNPFKSKGLHAKQPVRFITYEQGENYFLTISDPAQTQIITSRHSVSRLNSEVVNTEETLTGIREAKQGNETLEYTLHYDYLDRYPIKSLINATNKEDVLTISELENGDLPLYIKVKPHQLVSPGVYKDIIIVNLYSGTFEDIDSAIHQKSFSVPVYIHVQEVLNYETYEIKPSGEYAPLNLSFGEAQTKKTKRFGIKIFSNAPYKIGFRSSSGGQLLHTDHPESTKIKYSLNFDQETIKFNQDETKMVLIRTDMTSLNGHAYEGSLTLDKIQHQFQGRYHDNLNIIIEEATVDFPEY